MRALIPVLDSVNALPAVRHVVRESLRGERYEVQLVDVRSSLGHAMKGWLTADPLKPATEYGVAAGLGATLGLIFFG